MSKTPKAAVSATETAAVKSRKRTSSIIPKSQRFLKHISPHLRTAFTIHFGLFVARAFADRSPMTTIRTIGCSFRRRAVRAATQSEAAAYRTWANLLREFPDEAMDLLAYVRLLIKYERRTRRIAP